MPIPTNSNIDCTSCGAIFNPSKHNYCPKCGYEGDVYKLEQEAQHDNLTKNELDDIFDPDEL